jgi:archaemetzincin
MAPGSVTSVHLVPLGTLSLLRAQDLAARLSARIGVACHALALAGELSAGLVPGREQVDADALLARLESLSPVPCGVLMGVTPHDVAIPIFTFVFGRARTGGRAALVSLARLDPAFYGLARDDALLTRRAIQEMLHELGHLASLSHCRDAACVMSFAGSAEKIDVRGAAFCCACADRLPDWLARSSVAAEPRCGHMDCS